MNRSTSRRLLGEVGFVARAVEGIGDPPGAGVDVVEEGGHDRVT
jgi:hypothetical protein